MKAKTEIKDLVTFARYAEMKSSIAYPLSRQRVIQLVNEGRLKSVEIDGKKFISKFEQIKPSKKKLGSR